MKVGLIGLGNMGSAIAENLLQQKDIVTCVMGYTRTRSKVLPLIDQGLIYQESLADLLQHSDVIISSLFDASDLKNIFEQLKDPAIQLDKLGAGKSRDDEVSLYQASHLVWIDVSTIDPDVSINFAKLFQGNFSIQFVDAPISGSPINVKEGKSTIFFGGEKNAFNKTKTLLNLLASSIYYMGENGSGLYMKLAVNGLMLSGLNAFCESLVFCEKLGIDKKIAVDAMLNSAGTSPFLQGRKDYFLGEAEKQLSNPKIMKKDLNLANSVASKLGISFESAGVTENSVDFLLENLDIGNKDAAALFIESKRKN